MREEVRGEEVREEMREEVRVDYVPTRSVGPRDDDSRLQANAASRREIAANPLSDTGRHLLSALSD